MYVPEEESSTPLIALNQQTRINELTAFSPPTVGDETVTEMKVNSKGQLLGSEFITENTHQFLTVASDGQCLIWDTRFQVCIYARVSIEKVREISAVTVGLFDPYSALVVLFLLLVLA